MYRYSQTSSRNPKIESSLAKNQNQKTTPANQAKSKRDFP